MTDDTRARQTRGMTAEQAKIWGRIDTALGDQVGHLLPADMSTEDVHLLARIAVWAGIPATEPLQGIAIATIPATAAATASQAVQAVRAMRSVGIEGTPGDRYCGVWKDPDGGLVHVFANANPEEIEGAGFRPVFG
jgi:hypothetical protein